MDRRILLKYMALSTLNMPFLLQADSIKKKKHKNLILIELKGGNDGLNTVVPYNNPLYYKLRPNIALEKSSVLVIDDEVALHPSLKAIKDMYDKNEVAIVQGIGYPFPNRSHFRSIEIWDTASKSDEYLDDGWLHSLNNDNSQDIKGVVLGGNYGPLSGQTKNIIKIKSIKSFLNQSKHINGQIVMTGDNDSLKHILNTENQIIKSANILKKKLSKTKKLSYTFKKSDFSNQMKLATELIINNAQIPFYKLSLNGFDTHTNQLLKHSNLLKELSQNIEIMKKNLEKSGQWKDTIIMTYSEFGRRAGENASKGTDHGTAAPHFIVGGDIKHGIYGEQPSLGKLEKNGDLVYSTDFRNYYKHVSKSF
ncbi:MAG: Twin-arginine translocation pathway signal sequence domain-containing protein [Epsilonproteobacteria bacterium]|nr:MAG: Twin-arginine translocation pathway signal sequence domain-containing protein [Campylobacterota bacterium]